MRKIDDAPQAASVRVFFCENPRCHRPHVVLFDEHEEPFAQFVVPDPKPEGFLSDLSKAVYKSVVMRENTKQEHKLVGNTLNNTERGIVARCTCGWLSAPHFSSLAASAAFRAHQEGEQE